jgi:hypothetical protein
MNQGEAHEARGEERGNGSNELKGEKLKQCAERKRYNALRRDVKGAERVRQVKQCAEEREEAMS